MWVVCRLYVGGTYESAPNVERPDLGLIEASDSESRPICQDFSRDLQDLDRFAYVRQFVSLESHVEKTLAVCTAPNSECG